MAHNLEVKSVVIAKDIEGVEAETKLDAVEVPDLTEGAATAEFTWEKKADGQNIHSNII